jgi:hypothetical protein
MGGPCSTYGGYKKCIEGFVGKCEGRRPLGRSGVDGIIILGWIFKKNEGGHGLD